MDLAELDIGNFPDIALLNIFSYLNAREKLNCSATCRNWHRLVYSTPLWRCLRVTDWVYLNDPSCVRVQNFNFFHLLARGRTSWFPSDDGYVRMVGNLNELDTNVSDVYLYKLVLSEYRVLVGCLENILPKVGGGVVSVYLNGNCGVSDYLLNLYLTMCPNLLRLNVQHTSISSNAFKDLEIYGAAQNITHLDLSGCWLVTDNSILNLARCWGYEKGNLTDHLFEISVPYSVKSVGEVCAELVTIEKFYLGDSAERENLGRDLVKTFTFPEILNAGKCGVISLNLSGCYRLTDRSLEYLIKCPRFVDVESINLKGCSKLTKNGLKNLLTACPKLSSKYEIYHNELCEKGKREEEENDSEY